MSKKIEELLEKSTANVVATLIYDNRMGDIVDMGQHGEDIYQGIINEIKTILKSHIEDEKDLRQIQNLLEDYTEMVAITHFSYGIKCGGKLLRELAFDA